MKGNFYPTTAPDGNHEIHLHSITAKSEYNCKSFEELRLDHYITTGKASSSAKTRSIISSTSTVPKKTHNHHTQEEENKAMSSSGEKRLANGTNVPGYVVVSKKEETTSSSPFRSTGFTFGSVQSSSNNNDTSGMDKKSNWRCDKCQNAYGTYKEAEEHEKLCSGVSSDTRSENKKEVAKTSGFAFGSSVPTQPTTVAGSGETTSSSFAFGGSGATPKVEGKIHAGGFSFGSSGAAPTIVEAGGGGFSFGGGFNVGSSSRPSSVSAFSFGTPSASTPPSVNSKATGEIAFVLHKILMYCIHII